MKTREHAAHERMRWSMLFGVIAAMGVCAVLEDQVPHHLLLAWLGVRLGVSVVRLFFTLRFMKGAQRVGKPFRFYRVLCALDGLAWGALGWAVTPIHQLDVAIVTICVLVGLASLGSSMLHVDLPSASLFVLPMLLPNALHALSRHDRLGVFCAFALTGLTLLLILEARRANRRIVELMRLRFQSEQVTRAQAEALAQARALSETKSRFVATMSHEMRTPLHGILGLVRLLRQRESDALSLRQLDLIRSSGDHLVNVINDVLDFARLEAHGLPVQAQPFNLHAMLSEVAETASVTACEKGLVLELQVDLPRHVDTLGDPVRIRQVLNNLLGNAIKFTQEGFVHLHVARDAASGLVSFGVQDTGIGIPASEQAQIFQAFHQAEGTYQRRFGGTGLGLTISRELALAMGGELSCVSESGQGSLFTLALPLPEVASGTGLPSERESDAGDSAHQVDLASFTLAHERAPHVLVVEDNPVNALVVEAELQRLGIEVTVVTGGRQALDWLASQRTDLILMDCEMPEMDGIETTICVREFEQSSGRSTVPIVALTANGPEAYAGRCANAGMNDYLSKPFHVDELTRLLARHLRRSLIPG